MVWLLQPVTDRFTPSVVEDAEIMLTFFSTAKPFQGHNGMIQRNALKSWKLLHPDVEVILFGNETGVAEVCAELGLRQEPHVERHQSGMKYLDYMFKEAQRLARHAVVCYSNCDIVLLPDFAEALVRALSWRDRFLLVARRWDTDVTSPIEFGGGWARDLRRIALTHGRRQIPDLIDFFVFPRGFYDDVPPVLLGRSYWDHWLIWRALQGRLPVIDASWFIVPVHQNHTYSYHPKGKQGTNEDSLAQRNISVCGGRKHLRSMIFATHCVTSGGRIVWTPLRWVLWGLYSMRNKQGFLENTLWLRKKLGLRRETLKRFLVNKTVK
jgi:hypothetical protein